ncbi:MAG: protein kinase [Myxococcales bacterium]|nr:protein kinase [Myxococcales bacterium]
MAEQVGKYLLLKKLATGGMAEIHLAEQSGPGGFKKQLVIKRILPHLLGDEKFLQMFQDEARVAAVMNHPNIVQIFELGQHEENYFIAMEYVNGFNLRSVIQICSENGLWLAPEYIAKLASQICEGLEYAHSFCDADGHHLNLIHRDVSPQNIILSMQGVIKIVDFGIAKAQSTQETQAGTIKGKLAYMSPEQVKGLTLDRRSDIFSLGIVMYELATYNRPFHGKSDIDMLRAILNSAPVPVQQYRPDFPEEFYNIINRALTKNRDERYQSARELQWDIERFIQNWRKPIGPFQLQELVQKLDQMEKQKNPAATVAQPVVSTPPPPAEKPVDSDDYADVPTVWGNDSSKSNRPDQATIQQPEPTGGYPGHPSGGYQTPYNQPSQAKSWSNGGSQIEEWDDDDATVLSMTPPVSPLGGYSSSANANLPRATASAPRPHAATIADNHQSPAQQYLQPPPPANGSGPVPTLNPKWPPKESTSAPTQIAPAFTPTPSPPPYGGKKKSNLVLWISLAVFFSAAILSGVYFFVLR